MTNTNTIIVNLTQHACSEEQACSGVVDLTGDNLETLRRLLNFTDLPSDGEVRVRADVLAELAEGANVGAAMIGGAPFLMAPLERELQARGIRPLYAFSRRESREETLPSGSVRKVAVFRHLGFVDKGRLVGDGFDVCGSCGCRSWNLASQHCEQCGAH